MKKRLVAMMMMLVMVLSMAACGKKSELPTEPADIAKKANENANKVKNFECTGNATFDMEAAGQKVAGTITLKMATFLDPFKMKMDMTMDMGTQGKANMSMYFINEDDKYTSYTYMEMGGNGTWTKQEITDTKTIDSMKNGGVSNIAQDTERFKKVDSTDEKTTTLQYTLTADDFKKALEAANVSNQLSALGMSANIFDGIPDTPITITVDNDTVMWKTFSFDMKDLVNTILTNVIKGLGAEKEAKFKVNDFKFNMEYQNYDKATDFELPEEAKNAVDMNSAMSGITGAANATDAPETTDAPEATDKAK